jgi:hypothetical protein
LDIRKPINRACFAEEIGLSCEGFDAFIAFLADSELCGLVHILNGFLITDRTQESLESVVTRRKRQQKTYYEEKEEKAIPSKEKAIPRESQINEILGEGSEKSSFEGKGNSFEGKGNSSREPDTEETRRDKEKKDNRRIGRLQVSAPETSEVKEADDDPFDEKQALEAAAPPEPPVPVPSDEEALKARITEGEKSGNVAAVLMAGLELMNGHPFASYPKEWKAAHQVEEKIRRVGKGEHQLGFLRGLLQAYLAKRKSSKQEYWREAPLSPSALNVRFDQVLGSVQKLAADAQGAQIVSDFLKERQAK